MTVCRECGRVLYSYSQPYTNAKICRECLDKIPYDITIKVDNCVLQLHSEALTNRKITSVASKMLGRPKVRKK